MTRTPSTEPDYETQQAKLQAADDAENARDRMRPITGGRCAFVCRRCGSRQSAGEVWYSGDDGLLCRECW